MPSLTPLRIIKLPARKYYLTRNIIRGEMTRTTRRITIPSLSSFSTLSSSVCMKTDKSLPDKEDNQRRDDKDNEEDDDAKRLLLVCSHELAFHDRTGVQQHCLVMLNFGRPIEPAGTFDKILTLFATVGWLTLLLSFPCS